MKRFSATYVLSPDFSFLKNGLLEVNDDGSIHQLIDTKGQFKELPNMVYYSGILVPGFVNTHAHLELSFLKSKTILHQGIGTFVKSIGSSGKEFSTEEKKRAAFYYDTRMKAEGIKAVADVSNTDISLDVKLKSELFYHTYVELFGRDKSISKEKTEEGKRIKSLFDLHQLSASITPHAPYSLSEELWNFFQGANENISVHNQESKDELDLFATGTGPFASYYSPEQLEQLMKYRSSLLFLIEQLNHSKKILFVHNVYTNKADLDVLKASGLNYFFSFCPKSNLRIENKLPDFPLFFDQDDKLTIGTDSLASNDELSMIQELLAIQQAYPEIPLEKLVKWSTINGARFMDIEHVLGSFEKGKKPGINLIYQVDLENMKLKAESKVKVLL